MFFLLYYFYIIIATLNSIISVYIYYCNNYIYELYAIIIIMKSTKVQTLTEFGGNIGIFGLKTTFHAYVLSEHTSMKNKL